MDGVHRSRAQAFAEAPEPARASASGQGTVGRVAAHLEDDADAVQAIAQTGVRLVAGIGMIVMLAMVGLMVVGFLVVWVRAWLGWDMRL